ncbi:unnamed protein product [Echinostoma caproni]|uniref:CUB domain-containing protein n=1 Tax=Echinostoma caproni TaxID=27848 RepID=A0A183B2K6_9TREM|nr:unnamed protein product [Echinostoma caproni]
MLLTTLFIVFSVWSADADPEHKEAECGPANVELTQPQMSWRVPPPGMQFTSGTKCAFTFTTDPAFIIHFEANKMHFGRGGNCDKDYVIFGSTMEEAHDTKKAVCGERIDNIFPPEGQKLFMTLLITNEADKSFLEATIYKQYNPTIQPAACGDQMVNLTKKSTPFSVPLPGMKFERAWLCGYQVNAENNKRISVHIDTIKLGNDGGTCEHDFMRLADTPEGLGKNATVYCGTTPPKSDYISTNNVVYIVITSATNPIESYVTGSYLIDASQSVVLIPKCLLLGIWLNWLNLRLK